MSRNDGYMGSAEQVFWSDADAYYYVSLLEHDAWNNTAGSNAGP